MDPTDTPSQPGKRYLARRAVALALVLLVAAAAAVVAATRIDKDDLAPVAGPTSPTETEHVEPEDDTPPEIEVADLPEGLDPFRAVEITGEVDEDVTLKVGRHRKEVEAGEFSMKLPAPPHTPVTVVARDENGNTAETQLEFDIKWPPMRAVHVSGYAWATPSFRKALMGMIDKRLINTIQLDLKDESGVVSYRSKIPLAKKIGSAQGIYDLKDALRLLHKKKVRVVGRIVCFRDAILARASWPRHKERVIQRPDGSPYANYGGFTNFANEKVRGYNIDIAEEAARIGIDDILYDYVRRPDGPLKNLKIPGLKGSPERSIVAFVRETAKRLEPHGTKLGLSVYGIAATRPKEIAQDIPRMAKHADYISPMVYPSHWAPGEYNVGNPNSEPYKIVHRSLKDFLKQTRKTDATVIPWLQDFSLGVTYGAKQVRAQIDATYDRGIQEWILWDPKVTYTTAALDPMR
ncbi:MAG: putative glycoside hydrolase [Actinomycetota bacterium]